MFNIFKRIALAVLLIYAAGLSFVNYLVYVDDEHGWVKVREINSYLSTIKEQLKQYRINMEYVGVGRDDDLIKFSKFEFNYNNAKLELERVAITGIGSDQLKFEAYYNYSVSKEIMFRGDVEVVLDFTRDGNKLTNVEARFKLKPRGVERVEGSFVFDYSQVTDNDIDNLFNKALIKLFKMKIDDKDLLSEQAKATKDYFNYIQPELKFNDVELMSHVINKYLNDIYISLYEIGFSLDGGDSVHIKNSLANDSINIFVFYNDEDGLTLKRLYEGMRLNEIRPSIHSL